MVVRVDGKDYVVKRPHGSSANVLLADGSPHTYQRQYRPGTHRRVETDLEMQTRVQERVMKLSAGQERAQPLSACLTLGSPALSASTLTRNQARTRTATASAEAALAGRLRALQPRGRLPRRRRPPGPGAAGAHAEGGDPCPPRRAAARARPAGRRARERGAEQMAARGHAGRRARSSRRRCSWPAQRAKTRRGCAAPSRQPCGRCRYTHGRSLSVKDSQSIP